MAEAPLKSKALRLLFNEQLSLPPWRSSGARATARCGRPTMSAPLELKRRWPGPDACSTFKAGLGYTYGCGNGWDEMG